MNRHHLVQLGSCLMLVISSFAPPEPPAPQPSKMDMTSTPQQQQPEPQGQAPSTTKDTRTSGTSDTCG